MQTIKVYRKLRARLFPTKIQEQQLYQQAGIYRFIWNYALSYQIARYDQNTRYINKRKVQQNYKDINNDLTNMRNNNDQYKWLKQISRHSITEVLRDQYKSYKRIFANQDNNIFEYSPKVLSICKKENRYPSITECKGHLKFKRKKDCQISIPYDSNQVYINYNEYNQLYTQIPLVGHIITKVNYKWPIPFGTFTNTAGMIKSPRVKLVNNKWILFFTIAYEIQVPNKLAHDDRVIGIDIGIKILAMASNCGDNSHFYMYENINKTNKIKKLEQRRKQLQRKFDNAYDVQKKKANAHNQPFKYTRSKNMQKLLDKQKKIYAKLHNIRMDYVHKVTRDIINQQPYCIVIENFNLQFLFSNQNLAKNAYNQLLGSFLRQIKYKAEEYGIKVIEAISGYASTKLCSCCGNREEIKLNMRTYKCSKCGLIMDRDANAAKNLELYGMKELGWIH